MPRLLSERQEYYQANSQSEVNSRLSLVTIASVKFLPRGRERFHKTFQTAAITTMQM